MIFSNPAFNTLRFVYDTVARISMLRSIDGTVPSHKNINLIDIYLLLHAIIKDKNISEMWFDNAKTI